MQKKTDSKEDVSLLSVKIGHYLCKKVNDYMCLLITDKMFRNSVTGT
ncbi:MAG: hypothetical protein K0S80_95 [Neobacillus sp.]|nr:hypothetical protein [Neobacillus sp.]